MANRCSPLRSVFSGKVSLMVGCSIFSIALSLYSSPAEAQTQCTTSDPNSTDPCYAQNNDILSGQRSLLPDDDLVVNVWSKPFVNEPATINQVTLQTSQVTIASQSLSTLTFEDVCLQSGTPVTQSVIGRVFSLPNDVVVSIQPDSSCSEVFLVVNDPKNKNNNSKLIADAPGASANTIAAIALADFDRDGYQDVFFINPRVAQIWTAKCTNDPFAACTGTAGNSVADGLRFGAQRSISNLPPYASPPVTGDFNGDGIMDVAWPTHDASGSIQIRFMSVCPSANVTVLGHSCSAPFQLILASPSISTGGTAGFTSEHTPKPYVALTANNFDGQVDPTTGIATAELLVALANSSQTKATLTVYRFDQNLSPQAAATLADFPGGHNLEADAVNTLQIFLASGPLDGGSARPQAVFASTINTNDPPHRGYISVITFGEDLSMTAYGTRLNTDVNNDKKTRIFGLAVGRFDPPDDPDTGATDFDQQVAVLVDFNGDKTEVQLFRIPDNPQQNGFSPLTLTNHTTLQAYPIGGSSEERYYDTHFAQLAALSAGDLQGRSLLLGAPQKFTVAQTQPDIILGLPPMHVDFITPPGETDPQILNLTVFPTTFNTAYNFSAAGSSQSSRQQSTSYTTAYKETVESKVVLGNPKADSVTVKQKEAFTQTHQKTVSQSFNTYSRQSDSFASATEFDDLVAATSLQMNIYSYPVIGQFVCPDDAPDDCPDDQKQPLTVQYSGPDNIFYNQPAGAGNFEWYQPITEPGNIFSYPGNLSLLKLAETGSSSAELDLLSPPDIVWDSQSEETVSVHWSEGGGAAVSSGSVNSVSYDTSTSVASQAKGVGVSGSDTVGFDYNNSESDSTLNTSSVTFDASTGVVVHHGVGSGGAATDPNLLYTGQTHIFGFPQSEHVIQTDLTLPTDVQTHGRIEVAHTADILTTVPFQSGAWWKQAYTVAPDVALNHPHRWLQKLPTAQNPQQVMFNCPIGFTSAFGTPSDDPGSCTSTTTQPNPANVNDAPFYVMKGFFILPGNATSGPTLTLATLGDILTLQVRVYNYSLKNMDPGTEVHVRFYAQPWDAVGGQFASGNGKFGFAPAVFIGEEVLAAPIPAFCGGSQGTFDSCSDENAPPNWTLAQVQWDTSTLNPLPTTETSWEFWVVVWMTNGGQLVSEIAQHGLKNIPPQNVDSLAEIPVETYSNNLGFYNQVFTLELPTNSTVQAPAPGGDEQHFALEAFEAPETVLRDRLTTVRIHHRASGSSFDYVRAYLYEGDPLAGGKLLDMDIIPHVPQDSTSVVPFRYQPRACGARQLFVQAAPVNGGELAEAAFDVSVTLDPQAETHKLIEQLGSLQSDSGTKRSLLAKLEAAARSFQRGNQNAGLSQLDAFANEVRAQSGKKIPAVDAARLIALVEDLESCL